MFGFPGITNGLAACFYLVWAKNIEEIHAFKLPNVFLGTEAMKLAKY